MQSMGLKPWEPADAQEGKQITASFAAGDNEDKPSSASKSNAK